MNMNPLTYKYQKAKWKVILYLVIGIVVAFGAIVSAIFGGLSEEDCSPSTVSVEATSKSQRENAKKLYDFFIKEYGATPQGASGALGNMTQESQLSPDAVEDKSRALSGHGLAQWTAERTTNLMNFAKDKDKSWDNFGLQIEFMDSELKGSEKGAVKALQSNSVIDATTQWQVLYERAGDPQMGNRLSYAQKWFAEFGTSDPVASDTIGNASDGALESSNLACDDGSGTTSNNSIVKAGESMKGYFYYVQQHPSADLGDDLLNPNKNGGTDCSGFVWLALKKAGYKVPENMGWFTGSMASDARGAHKYLTEISEKNAKAGDIVIVNQGAGAGNNGHTAILLEDWKGKDTNILEQGGGDSKVNEGKFGVNFATLLNGGDVVLARAHK